MSPLKIHKKCPHEIYLRKIFHSNNQWDGIKDAILLPNCMYGFAMASLLAQTEILRMSNTEMHLRGAFRPKCQNILS